MTRKKASKWDGWASCGKHGGDFQGQVCHICSPPAPKVKVSIPRPRLGVGRATEVDTDGAFSVRFTLPSGAWFDVELVDRDGAGGLRIRGSDSMGIKLDVSNAVWLIPRDGKLA